MILFVKHFWPGIVWWNVVVALTLSPGNYFPEVSSFWNLFSPDKLIHLFIFGLLAWLLLTGFRKHYPQHGKTGRVFVPVGIALATGMLTEMLQAMLPIGREASIYDVVANATGCFAGYYVSRFYGNKIGTNLRIKQNNE